jgi:hypothetical protein
LIALANRTFSGWRAAVEYAQDARMNVEEALRDIRAKAALVRYLASSATVNPETPDVNTLAGMATVCEEIEGNAERMLRALTVSALETSLQRKP